MFLPFFLITIISFTLSLLFTPLVRNLAIRWNLVDAPDNKRKVHKKPIPRVGGVAVATAFFGSLFVMYFVLRHQHAGAGLSTIYAVAPAAILIFLIGLADDILDLKARHKFAAQIVAAVVAVAAGVHIPGFAATGLAAAPGLILSVMWLVLCTNAVNLIDGLDGLAGGISLLATITILIGSLATGNIGLTLVAAPLAAALLGFLVFNFNPASIFLGDSGSLLLGFLIGSFSLIWSGSATTTLGMMAPLLVLALPLLDVSLAIARRFLRGQAIFSADRAHIHHRLLARGLSHRGTVLTMYGAAAIAGALSLCLTWATDFWALAVVGVFAAAAIAGIHQLGYVEFAALRSVIFRGGLRSEITAQLAVQSLETGLEAAATADDCWATIQGGCEEFGFYATRMQLAGHLFSCPKERSPLRAWAMRVPISKTDWIELSNTPGPVRYPTALVPFVNTMREVLTDKSVCWMNRNDKTADYATGLYSTVVSSAN